MTDKNIKRIVISALIAALYATLTIALAPISYLGVQFRISEIMVLLAFYKKRLYSRIDPRMFHSKYIRAKWYY